VIAFHTIKQMNMEKLKTSMNCKISMDIFSEEPTTKTFKGTYSI